MRRMALAVICCLMMHSIALAATSTPSPTPTSTPTPTITPDVRFAWTVEVEVSGTPTPQEVVFSYSTDIGEIAINVEIGAIIVSIWIFGLFWFRRRK